MTQPLLTAEVLAEFERDGFCLGERLLTDGEADHLYGIVHDIVVNDTNPYHQRVYDFKHGGRPLLHIKNMWRRYDEFRRLHENPRILGALHALTGLERFHLFQDRFFYKPAGSGGYHTWHQDAFYHPFLEPYVEVGVWIALTEADAENGTMSMVADSHRWGDAAEFLDEIAEYASEDRPLPERYGEHTIEVKVCPVPKGHAHFHSGAAWHASGPNWSDRVRCGVGLFFVDASVRFDGNSRWAKDYQGAHGEHLDPDVYPLVSAAGATVGA
jgi:ectoine hydroxylase-related dioxygenase (phytanoyl-CoA dioxygenase family)